VAPDVSLRHRLSGGDLDTQLRELLDSRDEIVDRALEELEWCLERGARTVLVRPAPVPGYRGSRSFGLEEFDPFWQRVVGLSFGPLMATVAPLYNINHPKKRAAFAMGGFMLFRRETYEAIGGHESVKDQIIEDVALAARVKTQGFRLLVLPAPTLVGTHYFGTFGEIWAGVRKYLYASIGFRPGRLAFYTVLFLGWVFLPWIALV